jgi:hypothetical protein
VADERAAALACIDALVAATDRLDTERSSARHSAHVRSSYIQLLDALDRFDSSDKSTVERALNDALASTGPSFVNHHLLGSALIRSIAANPAYWSLDGEIAPRPELITRLDSAVDRLGREASPYGRIGEGIHAFVRGDDESAYDRLARAPGHPLFSRVVQDDFIGARTCRPLPALRDISRLPFPVTVGELDWLVRMPLGEEPCVITYSCDDSYFRAFASGIVASLPPDARGLTVHFHVVNPQVGTQELVNALTGVAADKDFSLNVSSEITDVTDRAYFASVRFLRMMEFLRIFGRPLVFLDTDSEFDSDPRGWLSRFSPEAVSILFCKGPWSGGFVPWRAFWAGIVHVPANALGRTFADVVHHVLAYLWRPEPHSNWFVDQNALYAAYLLVRGQSGEANFEDLPEEIYSRLRHSVDFKKRGLRDHDSAA